VEHSKGDGVRTGWKVRSTLMRPRRSVWSCPQSCGTFPMHRLCTFTLHSGHVSEDYWKTFALPALLDEPVEERATLVAEGGCGIAMRGEVMGSLGPMRLFV
jgi:hypothetical protein